MTTQTPSSTDYGDDQYRQMQRMQLHDISESNELYESDHHVQQQRSTPKENLMNLTQRVSDEDLKQAIRVEIKRLATDYERLVSVLQQRSEVLEQEYENLQLTEDSYQRRYEKALREMQFFKKKYDKAAELNKQYAAIGPNRRRSPSLDSNNSSLDHKYNHMLPSIPTSPPSSSISGYSEEINPMYQMSPPPLPTSPLPYIMQHNESKGRQLSRSSSSSTSSSNASGAPYWTGYTSELSPAPPPVSRIRQGTHIAAAGIPSSIHSSSTDGDSKNSMYLPGRKGSWQQLQPPSSGQVPASTSTTSTTTTTTTAPSQTSNISRTTTNGSQTGCTNNSVVQQRKVDPIAFGGSDPLWDTMAKSKTTDSAIEKMIR